MRSWIIGDGSLWFCAVFGPKSANLGLGRSTKNWVSATNSGVFHWNDQRDSISEPTGILLVKQNFKMVYTIHMVKLCKIGAGGSCCNLLVFLSISSWRWRRQLPGDNCGWHENRASCRAAFFRGRGVICISYLWTMASMAWYFNTLLKLGASATGQQFVN